MLNNVPTGINAMARSVIMRHPNSFNARVYRRKLLRSDPAAGGAPTIGGMMVLSTNSLSLSSTTQISMTLGISSYWISPILMPRCLPRPATLNLVTAGKPASMRAARTSSLFSGRTMALTMVCITISPCVCAVEGVVPAPKD